MKKLRLLIVDDHEVVRKGLSFILDHQPDFEVVGEARTAAEAVEKALEIKPDIIILDVRLGEGSGIQACSAIREQDDEIRIIMLSSYSDDNIIFDAIMAGANGFVLKEIKTEDLIRAIKAVGEGQSLLDPVITKKVMEKMKSYPKAVFNDEPTLNPQEKKVLSLIAEGKTNKEIAHALLISDKTVKNYVSNIFNKMNFNNRAEAAAYAVRHNIVFRHKA